MRQFIDAFTGAAGALAVAAAPAGAERKGKTEIGTPLDFVSFHAKGSPGFTDGHVRMGGGQLEPRAHAGCRPPQAFQCTSCADEMRFAGLKSLPL